MGEGTASHFLSLIFVSNTFNVNDMRPFSEMKSLSHENWAKEMEDAEVFFFSFPINVL